MSRSYDDEMPGSGWGYVKGILTLDIDKAESKVKGAWMAGVASGTVTLVFTLVAMKKNVWDFTISNLGDVLLIYTAAFGIYRKNRACAILLLVYFITAKVLIWMRLVMITDLPKAVWVGYLLFASLFFYFFFEGVRGTFVWHRLEREAKVKRAASRKLRKAVPLPREETTCVAVGRPSAEKEGDTKAETDHWWKL